MLRNQKEICILNLAPLTIPPALTAAEKARTQQSLFSTLSTTIGGTLSYPHTICWWALVYVSLTWTMRFTLVFRSGKFYCKGGKRLHNQNKGSNDEREWAIQSSAVPVLHLQGSIIAIAMAYYQSIGCPCKWYHELFLNRIIYILYIVIGRSTTKLENKERLLKSFYFEIAVNGDQYALNEITIKHCKQVTRSPSQSLEKTEGTLMRTTWRWMNNLEGLVQWSSILCNTRSGGMLLNKLTPVHVIHKKLT